MSKDRGQPYVDFEEEMKDAGESKGKAADAKGRFDEFDCPSCSANNPVPDLFGTGDEVICNYCGTTFEVKVDESGRAKFREA